MHKLKIFIQILAYFPYFENIKQAYEIKLLSACVCVRVPVYLPY
jgi:hypothetical protein